MDKTTYASKDYIPSDTVTIEKLGTARNRKVANLSISPVRYNPRSNVMEVITSMKIEIIFSNRVARDQNLLFPTGHYSMNRLIKACSISIPNRLFRATPTSRLK